MKSTLIHIGYPKTGTTWFQNKFYPNVKSAHFIPLKDVQDLIIRPHVFSFEPSITREHFLVRSGKRILICEERLLGNITTGGFNGLIPKKMGYRLREVFPDAQIVIFIRNQIDLISSAYGQYIKNGGTKGIDNYLFHKKDRLVNDLAGFSFHYFEFDKIIEFYNNLFSGNVFVFPYESFVRNHIAFLKVFTKELQLEVDFRAIDLNLINQRLNVPSYTKWRNRLPIPKKMSMSRITKGLITHQTLLSKRQSPKKILGEKNVTYIEQYYKDSNRKLMEYYNLYDLSQLGYSL